MFDNICDTELKEEMSERRIGFCSKSVPKYIQNVWDFNANSVWKEQNKSIA